MASSGYPDGLGVLSENIWKYPGPAQLCLCTKLSTLLGIAGKTSAQASRMAIVLHGLIGCDINFS